MENPYVNVWVLIDEEMIMENYGSKPLGTAAEPSNLGDGAYYYAYMMAASRLVNFGNGTAEIGLFVPKDSEVKFWATALNPSLYSVNLYSITAQTENVLSGFNSVRTNISLFQSTTGMTPVQQNYFAYSLEAAAIGGCGSNTNFTVVFQLLDQYGNNCGFYSWDASLQIMPCD